MTPMRAMLACVTACAVVGCGVRVDGDFGGVPWTPDATVLAYADRHELLLRDGAALAVKKNAARQTLGLLLTAARVDVDSDWRTLPGDELLEVRRTLALSDGIVLSQLRLADVEQNNVLRATVKDGVVDGDFDVAVAQSALAQEVGTSGLGARVTVTVTPSEATVAPRDGSVTLSIEVKREREAGQRGRVATGSVTLSVSTALAPERLADANFTVAVPILHCAQSRGPSAAGGCRDAAALPLVDDTGLLP